MVKRKKKNVLIFGATGSIGRNALEVLARLGDRFAVYGLTAAERHGELAMQAEKHGARVVGIANPAHASALRSRMAAMSPPVEVACGPEELAALAARPEIDIVLCAVTGGVGLPLTLSAVRAGKRLALANKESLVMAGGFVLAEAKKAGAEIIPVDSEHSALFQSVRGHNRAEVDRLILTASGGAFLSATREEAEKILPEAALGHPTWNMGPKVTIDSATMMNKALEVIEAHWLFNLPPSRIDVVIHPQAVIHSMVQFRDASIIAQLAVPDMKLPIQYALTFPDRVESPCAKLDLVKVGALTFQRPGEEKARALRLGYRAAEVGGTAGAVLNAANEVAVGLFLEKKIPFPRIVSLVEEVFNRHAPDPAASLDEILAADKWARKEAAGCIR
ncbi:MAG: 1-deoxy-D-xylulose-5-phosphate reductoisomerase [Planctomycetota bacterium]|nr:1-deoxy-D-xylulose-5-phosphate reductoisomerase [Planctomycetota bacterium]